MTAETTGDPAEHGKTARRVIALAVAALTLIGVGAASQAAMIIVVFDLAAAVVTVVPALLGGLCLVPLFRLGPLPLRWHLLLGSALGLGVCSTLVLVLGVLGVLSRDIWLVILLLAAALGVVRLRSLLQTGAPDDAVVSPRTGDSIGSDSPRGLKSAARYRQCNVQRRSAKDTGASVRAVLWLCACPFLILALLAASNAPGFIWSEEGFGYDVLEYHLQLPREYLQDGAIAYLPHNVYANFPANVEMLYMLAMIVLDDTRDVGTVANMIHLIFGALTVFAAWVAAREWSPTAGLVAALATASAGWVSYLCGLAYVENGMLFFGMTAVAIVVRTFCRTEPRTECSPDLSGVRANTRGHRHTADRGIRPALVVAGVMAGFACGCKYTAAAMIAFPLLLVACSFPGRPARARLVDGLVFTAAALAAFSPWLIKNQMMTGNAVFPLANSVVQAHPPGFGAEETEQWDRGHRPPQVEQSITARLAALWRHVPADRYQRFGPAIFLIALLGWFGRRRSRTDFMLLIMLGVQLLVWLLFTHLYARFAVVFLIPLALLCGRAITQHPGRLRLAVILSLLVAGMAWNVTFAAKLHRAESPAGAPASLIYDGRVPGYEYLAAVNHDLPPDARLLLIGEAKAFYIHRNADYCVAFNRNPFFERAMKTGDGKALLDWLRGRGYTHVLIHWRELERLAGTYGFSPPMTPPVLRDIVARLQEAGLVLVHEFSQPDSSAPDVQIFRL